MSKHVTWHRPGPRNLCAARTFYRNSVGEGRHAFLYPDEEQVVIRTRDAGLKRPSAGGPSAGPAVSQEARRAPRRPGCPVSRPRDSQRSALYRWEGRVARELSPALNRKLTLEECEELIARVWGDYRTGTAPPRVKDGRGTTAARGSRWTINLPRWARTPRVVLHEVAHALGPGGAAHGPEFARLYVELLNRYEGVPIGEAKRIGVHQKPRRVRFARAAACPKPKSLPWRKWRRSVLALERELKELRRLEPEP